MSFRDIEVESHPRISSRYAREMDQEVARQYLEWKRTRSVMFILISVDPSLGEDRKVSFEGFLLQYFFKRALIAVYKFYVRPKAGISDDSTE